MPKGKGIAFERKVAREYREDGWLVTRAGASLGLFDLVAIKTDTKEIELIQCKKGRSFSNTTLRNLANKLKVHDGVYNVKTVVIHEE